MFTDLYFGYQTAKSTQKGKLIWVDLITSLSPSFSLSKTTTLVKHNIHSLPSQEQANVTGYLRGLSFHCDHELLYPLFPCHTACCDMLSEYIQFRKKMKGQIYQYARRNLVFNRTSTCQVRGFDCRADLCGKLKQCTKFSGVNIYLLKSMQGL